MPYQFMCFLLFCSQGRLKLPRLTPHRVLTKATADHTLHAIHLAVQVIALHVADDLPVQVQLVQVVAAVVQLIDLAPMWQGQHGQVYERVALMMSKGEFQKAGTYAQPFTPIFKDHLHIRNSGVSIFQPSRIESEKLLR